MFTQSNQAISWIKLSFVWQKINETSNKSTERYFPKVPLINNRSEHGCFKFILFVLRKVWFRTQNSVVQNDSTQVSLLWLVLQCRIKDQVFPGADLIKPGGHPPAVITMQTYNCAAAASTIFRLPHPPNIKAAWSSRNCTRQSSQPQSP